MPVNVVARRGIARESPCGIRRPDDRVPGRGLRGLLAERDSRECVPDSGPLAIRYVASSLLTK